MDSKMSETQNSSKIVAGGLPILHAADYEAWLSGQRRVESARTEAVSPFAPPTTIPSFRAAGNVRVSVGAESAPSGFTSGPLTVGGPHYEAALPIWVRVPRKSGRCPWTGMSRSAILSILKTGSVRNILLREVPGRGGVRLILLENLLDHIAREPGGSAAPDCGKLIVRPRMALPEWIRPPRKTCYHTGLSRSWIYKLITSGRVHSKCLRKNAAIHGSRLIHLQSLLDYIEAEAVETS